MDGRRKSTIKHKFQLRWVWLKLYMHLVIIFEVLPRDLFWCDFWAWETKEKAQEGLWVGTESGGGAHSQGGEKKRERKATGARVVAQWRHILGGVVAGLKAAGRDSWRNTT